MLNNVGWKITNAAHNDKLKIIITSKLFNVMLCITNRLHLAFCMSSVIDPLEGTITTQSTVRQIEAAKTNHTSVHLQVSTKAEITDQWCAHKTTTTSTCAHAQYLI